MEEKKLAGYPSIDKPWLKYYSEEAIDEALPDCTIYEYLWDKNKDHLDEIALIFFDTQITFREFFKKIDVITRAFIAMGVKEKDVVTICIPNTPEAIYIFYALNRIGAICDFLDPRAAENVMLDHLSLSNATILITIIECYNLFAELKRSTNIENIIVLNVAETVNPFLPCDSLDSDTMTFTAFTNITNDLEMNHAGSVDDSVCILHTGGTTGIPKGVSLSNNNFHSLTIQYKHLNIFKRGYTLLSLMPSLASFGLVANMHVPLSLGVTLILIPEYVPEKIYTYIETYKPNCIPATIAHWETLFRDERINNTDFSFMRFGFNGGDTLSPVIEEGINRAFQKSNPDFLLVKGYGMTEASTAISMSFQRSVNRPLCVGCPLPQTTVGIFDEQSNELPYGAIGEICVQSNGVMLGYYNNAEATNAAKKVHKDGQVWLHTGDMGCMTEEGLLYIKGRIKRMIIRYDGLKVYSIDVETKLNNCPLVKASAVVGMQDPRHIQGQVPVAFIVLKEDENAKNAKEIIHTYCDENIFDFAVPYDYFFIDELPRTSFGKIDYRALEKQAEVTSK